MTERSGINGHFTPDAGTVDEVLCGLCSTKMTVKQGQWGPTSFAEGMSGTGHGYDEFSCPHRYEAWHKKAQSLVEHGNESPCRAIREMHLAEADEILLANRKEKYFRDPEFEKFWDPPVAAPQPMYELQNRYQDSGWESMNEAFGSVHAAVINAYQRCQNAVAYGMVRVVEQGTDRVVVEFPAGGYQ